MTIAFWATAALLLAGGMLFVLPPLLRPAGPVRAGISPTAAYREQRAQLDAELAQGTLTKEQHAEAIAELQARVVEEVGELPSDKPVKQAPQSKLVVAAVAIAIPLGALALYGVLGTPSAMLPPEQQQAAAEGGGHAISDAQMEQLLQRVVEKLKANPDDYEGWHILARSYGAMGRLPQAVDAYEHAYKLKKDDANMLADYADVLAMANGRNLEGKPEQLVKEALKADPKNQKSLALMGTVAYNKQDFAGAASWWKKLLATVEPNSEQALAIQANIRQAEAGGVPVAPQLSAQADKAAPSAPADKAVAAGGPGVEGNVVVADSIKGSIPAGATLFVYARPVDGSRMPLAILRVPASSFPYAFKLDDSMAMSPESRLSLQPQVQLVARISKSGNAMGSPGDLTGTVGPVKVGSRDVRLVIDQAVK